MADLGMSMTEMIFLVVYEKKQNKQNNVLWSVSN